MSALHDPPVRVMALHALAYCERLFYLEEVEEIRLADERVFAGRELHQTLELQEGEERRTYELSSEALGLTGKLDAVRHRDGGWVVYEHKRGRPCSPARKGDPYCAWPSDELQVSAYGMLLEEAIGQPVAEGRVRYHAAGATVRVPLDDPARRAVLDAVKRARVLRTVIDRPPVTWNERLCIKCSLAPVCLPEEERLVRETAWEPVRLFPNRLENTVVHVLTPGARVTKSGETLSVESPDTGSRSYPISQVQSVVLHGYVQITTQALQLCATKDIPVHWLSGGGYYYAGTAIGSSQVQRRIRQYEALRAPEFCLSLARRLVQAKVDGQLRYLLRATRGSPRSAEVQDACARIRNALSSITRVESPEELLGCEGTAGRAYYAVYPNVLLSDTVPETMHARGRNRRPPRDRYNALLSFGYALLYRQVMQALVSVGFEPAFGFYHTPRSAAHPLVMDVMELFRVIIWDIPLLGAVNRRHFDPQSDFAVSPVQIWLSAEGKKKAIALFERRLQELWKHPVIGYSLEYARAIELEARLLEKEWTGQPGLFARSRIR